MVWASTIRARAKKTKHRQSSHPRATSGLDHLLGAVDVDALAGLVADLTVDPRTMHDAFTIRECLHECILTVQTDWMELGLRQLPHT